VEEKREVFDQWFEDQGVDQNVIYQLKKIPLNLSQ
jgi:hypothetical protein